MSRLTPPSAMRGPFAGAEEDTAVDLRSHDVARTLRALVEANDARSVLVVGVDRGVQGLSTRLAAAEARAGRATILVDADLREPSDFAAAGSRIASGGLSAWLLDHDTSEGSAPPGEPSDVPNLSVIHRGERAVQAADALDGPRLDDLVPALLRQADRVVIASSPLWLHADALSFARRVDQVLVVINPGRTRRDAAIAARDAIRLAGGRIAGIVLDT